MTLENAKHVFDVEVFLTDSGSWAALMSRPKLKSFIIGPDLPAVMAKAVEAYEYSLTLDDRAPSLKPEA